MRSYEAARTLFSFLAFMAWIVIIIGVIVAVVAASGVSSYYGGGAAMLAMGPGVGIALAGFIQLAFVQMARATVDTAEYTQQMLKISRDQLEVSKQSLKAQNELPKTFKTAAQKETVQETKSSFADQVAKSSPSERETKIPKPVQQIEKSTVYKGKTIRDEQGKYLYGGIPFETLLAAKEYIDSFAKTSAQKLPGAIRRP